MFPIIPIVNVVISQIRILFNIVQAFTTLNMVFS